tara:strand:+ start:900 stop:1406 length:507 start_codon:yes stop_codon:yes gene_type:complete
MTGRDDAPTERLAEAVIRGLASRNARLVAAESCTGGMITAELTAVPGASDVVCGAYVVYRREMKERALGLDPSFVTAAGTVSEEITVAMATAARTRSGADVAVATTCSAGPSTESGSARGESYIAVADSAGQDVRRLRLDGDRSTVRRELVRMALVALVERFGLTVRL